LFGYKNFAVKTSGVANKKKKQSFKKDKKENFKKSVPKTGECNICYTSVTISMDNTITCGKTSHTICGECKVRMKNDNCPMCRSHPVKQPIACDMFLNVRREGERLKKPKGAGPDGKNESTPKQRRGYMRTGPYIQPFGPNTNRLIRQRRNAINQNAASEPANQPSNAQIYMDWLEGSGWTGDSDSDSDSDSDWLTEEQVLRYNGSVFHEAIASQEYESDTETTLSLDSSEPPDLEEGEIPGSPVRIRRDPRRARELHEQFLYIAATRPRPQPVQGPGRSLAYNNIRW
jgi:hypothetical protein